MRARPSHLLGKVPPPVFYGLFPFQTYPYLPGNWTIALQSGREPFLRFFILKREKSFVHAESYSVVELLDW